MTDLVWDPERRRFTNSELKTFKRCRRKWWLSQYRRLRWAYEPRSGARAIGTRLHTAMETMFNVGYEQAIEELRAMTAADMEEFPEQADDIAKDADLVLAMMEGYLEWSQEEGIDEDYQVLTNEQLVEVMMPGMPNVSLLGKLDQLVLRKSTREVMFRDWKTVADFSRIRLLQQDEQMLHYMLLLRMLAAQGGADLLTPEQREWAAETVGAVYAMFRKVKRTARAKPPFYSHHTIRHPEVAVAGYFQRVWFEVQDILALEAQLDAGADPVHVAYPNPTRDCSWDCDFQVVCAMFDDGSDVESVLAAQYEVRSPLERYNEDVSNGSSE